MTNIIERMQMQFSDMNVQKNIPLSGLTTLRVGGKADYLLTAEKEETSGSESIFGFNILYSDIEEAALNITVC